MQSLSLEELANEAEVDPDYVSRLTELGAIQPRAGDEPYGPSDTRRIRLIRAWEEAGLSVKAIMDLVRSGELSLTWLDTSVMTRSAPRDQTYDQLCSEEGVTLGLVQALYEALGFAPPEPVDRAREGDRELLSPVKTFLSAGALEAPTLRLVRVYADSMRRVAKAEAELYESEIEQRLRASGRGERELLDFGARFGERLFGSLERALLEIYHRHKEHIWIEHSINHAEAALEQAGLFENLPRPPAICFVDLTGYTRLTEERGDEVAAQLASSLSSLVVDISRRHGGRAIRWLGDGGMFHFREPRTAVLSALDMVESAPGKGLPPLHIGIHTGPVVFQDGDVYGRTVNLASRIASYAKGGQVLASEETVSRSPEAGVRFDPVGPVSLKGVDRAVNLFQAVRQPTGGE
jgi:adenylate cyclase